MESIFDLDHPLDEITFALFDVETTGLSPAYGHRICEIACLRLRSGTELGRMESLIDPGRAISPGAYRVNRIEPEMLAGAPTFDAIASSALDLMVDAVLVAHNAPFDLGFLATELEIAGLPPPEGPVVDTLTLSRRAFNFASNSLSAVAGALQVPVEPTHRAMVDVETTRHVLEEILRNLDRRWGVTTLGRLLDFQGGSIPYPLPLALPLPPTIAEALESRGRVLMRYVDARGRETERIVRPLRVSERHGMLYLTAHCHQRGELRTFRLDRVLDLAREDESSEHRHDDKSR
jgi:DNA polymerase-3 subunit epsilon